MRRHKDFKEHGHDHDHSHEHHEHNHGSTLVALIAYAIGLGLFVLSMFIKNDFWPMILGLSTIILSGYHVILEGIMDTIHETKANKKFSPNVHILMTLAAIGAILIQQYSEASLLILIFAGAHFLEDYAEDRSRKEISNLLNITPQKGRRINTDGSIDIIDIKDIKINDKLQVLIGDQIPTDGVILTGKSDINEATITGESMPVIKSIDDAVYGATINLTDELIIKVTKDSHETVIAKIIDMVSQTKKNLSKTAKLIKKIEPIYVKIVLLMAPVFYLVGRFLIQWTDTDAFYRTMVYLIVVSPCALAATDIPATLSAISNLAKKGVLFKGGSYLSNLSDMKVVAFDKTGTITEGKPVVVDTYYDKSLTKEDIEKYVQILVSMEYKSNHPLAEAIKKEFHKVNHLDIDVENIIGVGLKSNYMNNTYLIAKPTYFKNVSEVVKKLTETYAKEGKTVIYFAKNDEVFIVLSIQDIAKSNVKEVMDYFKSKDIKTVMITGDSRLTAEAIASKVGITDIYANVLPEQKQAIVTELQEKYGVTAMLGDGINDAPALTKADIGIAMKDGTDIAIDVADGVLMQNDLSKFIYTHKVSKKLRRVVWQNIFFSMGVVLFLITLNVIGHMDLPFAVLVHEGSTIVVILNGLRLLLPIRNN